AVPVAAALFLTGSRSLVLAGHDAVVSPRLDGYATLDLGPYLPDLRYPTGHRLGARIDLGKTTAGTYSSLIERYAFLASQPEAQIQKVRDALRDLAVASTLDGALAGVAGPMLVLLVGRRRWAEVRRGINAGRTSEVVVVLVVATLLATRPWDQGPVPVEIQDWNPVAQVLPEVSVPLEARPLEVQSGLLTSGTRQLVASAVDTYRRSVDFYSRLVEAAPQLADQLRRPADDEVVGILVTDRHDNIGMDPVARAIADQGGATFLLDAGDDTSTGSPWEAFSLESLDRAFEEFDPRFAVAGNHDNGDFVTRQADELGFTTLDGSVVDGPGGLRVLGAADPRSSGLGTWRDQRGISFGEQEHRLADLACRHDADGDRVGLLLVHDANSGREALRRGCVDVVLAGHVHTQIGPVAVTGPAGTGYSYTNGTTGGAAYAVAIGSKLRRDAEVTLVTVRGGTVRGLQPVIIGTAGTFRVQPYVPLDPGSAAPLGTTDSAPDSVPGDPAGSAPDASASATP
ncbi:MAG: metallophosphoesterase, partial [Nocardioidaceae bacterium]